jgi:hypothetical protein
MSRTNTNRNSSRPSKKRSPARHALKYSNVEPVETRRWVGKGTKIEAINTFANKKRNRSTMRGDRSPLERKSVSPDRSNKQKRQRLDSNNSGTGSYYDFADGSYYNFADGSRKSSKEMDKIMGVRTEMINEDEERRLLVSNALLNPVGLKTLHALNILKEDYDIEKESRIEAEELYEDLLGDHRLALKGYKDSLEECNRVGDDLKDSIARLEKKLDDRLCCCCFDHESDVVLLPCSHFRTCLGCTKILMNDESTKKCPNCRTPISGYIKLSI